MFDTRSGMEKSTRKVGKTSRTNSGDERVEELRRDLDALAERVDSVLRGEDWIQAKLYDLNVSVAALAQAHSGAGSEAPPIPGTGNPDYSECVRKIRETVRRVLPRDATVVVASK